MRMLFDDEVKDPSSEGSEGSEEASSEGSSEEGSTPAGEEVAA